MKMNKKLPIGRTVACVIAGLFVLAGAYFLFEGVRLRREFYEQSKTRPLDIPVDFSKPGTFTAPFPQTWQACHGQAINLQVPTNALAATGQSNLLATLRFTWHISGPDGDVVADDKSSGGLIWDDRPHGGTIPLIYFHPFDIGDYTFSCTVTTAAPALAGLEQRLVCQYQPCGLEMMIAVFSTGIGIAALVIAGIMLLIVRAITKRKNRNQTTTECTVPPEGAPSDVQ